MPLWNVCCTAVLAAYQVRQFFLHRRAVNTILSNSTKAPAKYSKMMRKLARKMNIRHPEAIEMVLHDRMACSAGGVKVLPADKVVLQFPKAFFDEQFARVEWNKLEELLERNQVEVSASEATKIRMMFGIKVPRNVHKFNIVHELAHLKYNDSLKSSFISLSWPAITTWPATNLVLEKLPLLHTQGMINCDFMASVVDPVFALKFIGVSSLWFVSYVLFGKYQRQVSFMQEFRADKTAAEIDVDIARGGLVFLKAEKTMNQKVILTAENAHLQREYDNEGNHIKSPSHPCTADRISAIEEIIEKHHFHFSDLEEKSGKV